MRALVFDGALQVREVALPVPLPDEALIRVKMAGVCNTDLEILSGYKGFNGILGHEFVGQVVQTEDSGWMGARVCGEINIGCGHCARCRNGTTGHCAQRQVVGILDHPGVFADYAVMPTANLHRLPDTITDEQAVFVEPLAAAFQIREQVQFHPDQHVVVLGDGKMGTLCAQALMADGIQPLVIGKHPSKLDQLSRLGIETRLLGDLLDKEVDVVIEATGSSSGMETAMSYVRPRGTIVLKSTFAGKFALDLSPLVVKEIALVGSRCGPFPRAIDALARRQVQVDSLISARYPLSRATDALHEASRPGILKVLLDMSHEDGGEPC